MYCIDKTTQQEAWRQRPRAAVVRKEHRQLQRFNVMKGVRQMEGKEKTEERERDKL